MFEKEVDQGVIGPDRDGLRFSGSREFHDPDQEFDDHRLR